MAKGTKLLLTVAALVMGMVIALLIFRHPGVKIFLQLLLTPEPTVMSAATVLKNPSEYESRMICIKGEVSAVAPFDKSNDEDPLAHLFDGTSGVVKITATDTPTVELWINQAASASAQGALRDVASIPIGTSIKACGFPSVGGISGDTLMLVGTAFPDSD